MNKYGGRRFMLVVGCGLVYTALLVAGYIDPTVYGTLQLGTVATYIAGNGYQKHSETRYGSQPNQYIG